MKPHQFGGDSPAFDYCSYTELLSSATFPHLVIGQKNPSVWVSRQVFLPGFRKSSPSKTSSNILHAKPSSAAKGCIHCFEQINQVSLPGLGPERGVANLQLLTTDLDAERIADLSSIFGSDFATSPTVWSWQVRFLNILEGVADE